MKPLSLSPAQAQRLKPESSSLPLWSQLPLARQQELIRLLSSLLLRHWPKPAKEVSDDSQP